MSELAFAAGSPAPGFIAVPAGAPQQVPGIVQDASLRGAVAAEAAASVAPGRVIEAALPIGLAGLGAAALARRSAKHATRCGLPSAVVTKVPRSFFGGSSSSTYKPFDPASELGVQEPVGFWDPLGFTADGDEAGFKRRRSVELKHGRVAMAAAMGYITPEYYKFPGYLSPSLGLKFSDVPNGLAALSKVPSLGWVQIIFFAGVIEGAFGFDDYKNGTPGEYGWKVLSSDDPAEKSKKLSAELANGRLAMMAIIGMFFQDGLTGSAWGDWALYSDSPLRAFENELGVQDPVGFWDPLGFTADGDLLAFKRRRCVELKHGRISMLATMGYITPEITGKFPGYLSPSIGLKFEDVPNGLAAVSKIPALGWVQMVAYAGYCELSGPTTRAANTSDYSDITPGDYGFKVLTSDDPVELTKKLNAEIANGRLAMMAIMGMFFQDGLTGSAWGDWSLYTDSPLRAFENELGVQAPVGFWDPLGLSKDGNVETFKRRRATEIKHGRISMLATMGYITPEVAGKFPGYLSPSTELKFADIPNGLAAISKVPAAGWWQIFAYAFYVEFSSNNFGWLDNQGSFDFTGKLVNAANAKGDSRAPGDVGWRPPLLATDDAELKKKRLNAEIANGRLAMMAIIGMFFQDGLTGSAWGDWALYTDSPLRAFENELGVQDPVGVWDPAGFTADGDVTSFKRRRTVELKHGRISMLATMGYITPELTGKFPGYLSPSADLKFADIPNGLAAISKVPALGWAQVVAYAGFCELSAGSDDWKTGTPGDYGFKVLTASDPAEKTKKLSAELANGRLAMMAIIGMFFQDGLTGSAWGDWALYTDSPLRAFESELGVQAPLGFWDPLGFTQDGDVASFNRRRQVELKHGRVCMLATMGYITPEITGKFDCYLSPTVGLKFTDIPNGLAAIGKVPFLGWLQILGWGAWCELSQDQSSGTPGAKGDFGWKLITSSDPEAKTRKLNAELANGRLAMMAIIGMFFQDGLTGSAWGDWALYTDSPLRAFENELGVQAPVGFWDPAGFTKDGDVDAFKRRREVELKHGRVAMFATMGYITPEYFKFPGFLSPSSDLQFADVPNGLAAISKVPALGWVQWFIFCGLVDFGLYRADPSRDPGDYENAGILGVPNASGPMQDAEGRKRKLNAELANGRLAMVAIMGMMFQNGTFGTTAPDMWGGLQPFAFESELGVQAPVGFWDPAGMTKDGDALAFRRRRETELKHGRVAMLACMGYITPEYFKFPGFCATDLSFAEIPNGLAAFSKVPGAGWLQIFLFIGAIEKWLYKFDASRAPGDFENGGILGAPNGSRMVDGPAKTRKLNSELANGRLAMMAIIGMFFQDGLTGQAWGDWSYYTDSPLRACESDGSA